MLLSVQALKASTGPQKAYRLTVQAAGENRPIMIGLAADSGAIPTWHNAVGPSCMHEGLPNFNAVICNKIEQAGLCNWVTTADTCRLRKIHIHAAYDRCLWRLPSPSRR